MFCSNCGAQLAEGTKFCAVCGTPVQAAPVAEPEVAEVPAPEAAAPEYVPVEAAPVVEEPAYVPPVEAAPVYEAPAEEPAPVYAAPVEEPAPVYTPPVEEPVYELPVDEPVYVTDAAPAAGVNPVFGETLKWGIMALAFASTFWISFLGIVFGLKAKKTSEEALAANNGAPLSGKAKVGSILGKIGLIVGIVMTAFLAIYLFVIMIMALVAVFRHY